MATTHTTTRPRLGPVDGGGRRRSAFVAAAAGTVLAAVTGIAISVFADGTAPPGGAEDPDVVTQHLVDRGLVPRQTLDPLPEEDALGSLVRRGLVPEAALTPAGG